MPAYAGGFHCQLIQLNKSRDAGCNPSDANVVFIMRNYNRSLLVKHLKAISIVLASLFAYPAMADQTDSFVQLKSISLPVAKSLAEAALTACRKNGYTVSVAVTDRAGVVVAMLRDVDSGTHTPSIALSKAYTAANFRSSTTDLVHVSEPGQPAAAIRNLPNVAILGGGLPITYDGDVVGAIGVSGAPGGHLDEACAKEALLQSFK